MNRNPEPRGPGISRLQAGEDVNKDPRAKENRE